MDLGIAGRRAAVAAASGGLGPGVGQGARRRGRGRRHLRPRPGAHRRGRGGRRRTAASRSSATSPARPAATAFVAAATEALGGIDILVTNAGGPPPGNFASTDVDAYPAAIDLNLMSVVAMCKAAVPAMQAAGWGRVVAITSLAVRQPIAELILSNTARAGATGFLKTLAREVAERRRDGQLACSPGCTARTG